MAFWLVKFSGLLRNARLKSTAERYSFPLRTQQFETQFKVSVRIENSVFSFRIPGTAGGEEKCGSFRGGCCSILYTIILNLLHELSSGQTVDCGLGASFATFKPTAICQVKQINRPYSKMAANKLFFCLHVNQPSSPHFHFKILLFSIHVDEAKRAN